MSLIDRFENTTAFRLLLWFSRVALTDRPATVVPRSGQEFPDSILVKTEEEVNPMVPQRLASFAPRPRRWKVALVPALLILTAMGCGKHHKRTTLRPVFVAPSPCSTPGCTTSGSMPGTLSPSSTTTLTPSAVESSIPSVVEPSASTLGAPAEPAPSATGASSIMGSGTGSPSTSVERIPSASPGPARSGSTRSSAVEEPGLLEPIAPGSGQGNGTSLNPPSSSSLTVPRLEAPGTSLNSNGNGDGTSSRRNTPARPRKVSLREQLTPFTNNPDDLFAPPKADRPWKYVVLHHSANPSGSYEEIDKEHRKRLGWEGCGYHFVVGNGSGSPDGQIEVAQRWSDQKHGIHCRNGKNPDVSEYGIGICMVGNLDDAPPTPRQIAATRALIAYLGSRYNIPTDHIDTHAHLANSPTACPGQHFPSQDVLGSGSNLARR